MATSTRPPDVSHDALHEVIEHLAEIDRTPGSVGERAAAAWLVERFRRAGCAEVALEEAPTWGPFPPTITGLGVLGLAGALQVAIGRKRGTLLALAAAAGLVDEIQNGPRLVRRAVRQKKTTTNVIARLGDLDAEETLVVLAHHDAAQTGRIFDQTLFKALHRAAPDLLARQKKQVPQWWIGLAAPLLTILGALTGSRRLKRWSVISGALAVATIADIKRSPTVPGANDNLSGVAVLVALAEALREKPVAGLRVVLASCGAEETLQDGVRAFMEEHEAEFPPGRTSFLNFDTVGSPQLAMLEGEGPVWMEHYADPGFRDRIERCASSSGIDLERGFLARASTDSIIPSRAGHATATLVSLMPWRVPGNYHLMTDVPENIDYDTVADCVRLALAVAEDLSSRPS